MVELPFSAAAAAVLLGAMIAGGAIGVMTAPPAEAPSVRASAEPAAAPSAVPASEPVADMRPPVPKIEQTVIEAAPPNPAPLKPENVVQRTETTTVVSAPVIVTGLGFISGCVGCIERRNDDTARRPTTRTEHPTSQHAAAPRREIPPHVQFVRPPQVASASLHRR